MIGRYSPPPDPDRDLVLNLALSVRELSDRPHRWAWDLTDSRDRSWFESMFEFDSAEQALRSGLSRLAELGRCASDTGAAPRAGETEAHHVVIVSGDDDQLYSMLTDLFAGSESVEVIRDRRKSSPAVSRRSAERRLPKVIALPCGCERRLCVDRGTAPLGRLA
jgi:hypothetical protein